MNKENMYTRVIFLSAFFVGMMMGSFFFGGASFSVQGASAQIQVQTP